MMRILNLKIGNENYFFKIFITFLCFYSTIFFLGIFLGKIPNYCVSDECRYFENVFRLINGEYQDPLTDRLVTPMHSILIAPIVLLDIGRRAVVFLNLIISSSTISLTYLTSRFYLSNKISLLISIVWGLYYIKYEQDFTALTEPFTTFLILFNFYLITNYRHTKKNIYLFFSGLTLGMLSLERPIFLYVLLALIAITTILLFRNKKYFSFLISFILAFSLTIPYQLVNFKSTGRILMMTNHSGETLYWMSTPYEREYGDWNNENFDSNCQTEFTSGEYCNSKFLEKNHGDFFDSITKLNMLEKNQALFSKGVQNIIKHPIKYLRNVISNISRLLFNTPGSFMYQREVTIFRFIPNSIIFTLIIFGLFISLTNLKKIPKEMIYCLSFTFIYLALSSLVTAYSRMFTVIVPYILIWTSYSLKIWKDS